MDEIEAWISPLRIREIRRIEPADRSDWVRVRAIEHEIRKLASCGRPAPQRKESKRRHDIDGRLPVLDARLFSDSSSDGVRVAVGNHRCGAPLPRVKVPLHLQIGVRDRELGVRLLWYVGRAAEPLGDL